MRVRGRGGEGGERGCCSSSMLLFLSVSAFVCVAAGRRLKQLFFAASTRGRGYMRGYMYEEQKRVHSIRASGRHYGDTVGYTQVKRQNFQKFLYSRMLSGICSTQGPFSFSKSHVSSLPPKKVGSSSLRTCSSTVGR